jgi:epoxyqueuosine reductase
LSDESLRVKALGLAVGFDLAGIAPAEPTRETAFLREWLARGYAGEMHWIGRRAEERVDPRRVLPGAQSVVALALVYDPGERGAAAPGSARVARYAGGEDYHDVLLDRVRAFEAGLAPLLGRPVRTRGYVDTGPVLERAFAARAGLGWIGKNSCVIHPRLGSYLFLAVVLTDAALAADAPEPDHCGSCRACLDACPTQAFPEPYVLDATRCISYTTIESRGPLPEPLRAQHGGWVFGCDVCQEVCPWNLRERRRIPDDAQGLRARLAPREPWLTPTLAFLLELDEARWRAATRRTALRRARYRGLLRNALVAAGNSGDASLAPLLRRHAEGDDPLLAEHARWALSRLGAGPAAAPAPPGARPA